MIEIRWGIKMFKEDINQNTEEVREIRENIEKRLEDAFKIYKLSEVYLNNVNDDYGKLKIAKLRLDFARHELLDVIKEANSKGIKLKDNEMINKFLYDDV